MNLGKKKQVNIYVSEELHALFLGVVKNLPFSVGDFYVLSAIKAIGGIPDIKDPDFDLTKLSNEAFKYLHGGQPVANQNPAPVVKKQISLPEEAKPEKKVKLTVKQGSSKKTAKVSRSDARFQAMMKEEEAAWKPCFEKFTYLAEATAICSPVDEDGDFPSKYGGQNLYIITFMGYSNSKKGSHGVYGPEPLLATNRGHFITTLICGDPEGKQVYAGRSVPKSLFLNMTEDQLRDQALSTPEVMFTTPSNLSEEEAPFWGFCKHSLGELEHIFEQNKDLDYLAYSLSDVSAEDFEGLSFKEALKIILVEHYLNWQYLLENNNVEVTATTFEPQGPEEQ